MLTLLFLAFLILATVWVETDKLNNKQVCMNTESRSYLLVLVKDFGVRVTTKEIKFNPKNLSQKMQTAALLFATEATSVYLVDENGKYHTVFEYHNSEVIDNALWEKEEKR